MLRTGESAWRRCSGVDSAWQDYRLGVGRGWAADWATHGTVSLRSPAANSLMKGAGEPIIRSSFVNWLE